MTDKERIRELEESLERLNREKLEVIQALETAAGFTGVQRVGNFFSNATEILPDEARRIRRILPFKSVSFLRCRESDPNFRLVYSEPPFLEGFVKTEIDALISNHSFAWALQRSKPVVLPARNNSRIMLHVLRTSARIEGMFVGLLPDDMELTYHTLKLLTITMHSCAQDLESMELYLQLKRAKDFLQHSMAQQSGLIDALAASSTDIIYYKGSDGRYLDCNRAFQNLLHARKERILGRTAVEVFGQKVGGRLRQHDSEVMRTRSTKAYVETFVMPHGETIFLDVVKTPHIGSNGEILGIVGVCRDITERKLHEDKLRKLQRAVDQSPTAIVITDADGQVDYVNPGFTATTQYSQVQAIGGYLSDLGICSSADMYSEIMETVTNEETWSGEFQCRKKDNSLYWCTATVSPVKDEWGKTTYQTWVMEDVTDRKYLERIKEDVDRMIRHDLKAPLTGIINLPRLVREDTELSPEHEEMLIMVEDAGYRILDIINLSMDMYKMEMGQYTLSPVPVDLLGIARTLQKELQELAAPKHVGIILTLPEDLTPPVKVKGDPLLCQSLFSNLMKNAIEAAPELSDVTVSLELTADHATTRIRNQGEVPDDIRETFFEKYVTEGKKTGTGLGTYSAKLITETLEGSIVLDTETAGETTLAVTLPLYQK